MLLRLSAIPLYFAPPEMPVRISVTFTWDIPLAQKLYMSWKAHYEDVQLGGPAFDDAGGEFIPGRFIKEGVTITSRGCPRHCKFCLVPRREGRIRKLEIKDGWIVQDNNLLACPANHIEKVFEMLRRQPEPIDFAAGLDARLLEPWHIELFKSINLGRLWFACDLDGADIPLSRATKLLGDFPRSKKWCYVLVGYRDDSISKAELRLKRVWDLGFMPFAMLYQGPNGEGHKGKEWRRFQRTWCRPAAYKALMKVK